MARSLNGWTVLAKPRVTRPGPDNRNPSGFANDDVADILSAVMWWWHTELETVTQWGGHRAPDFNAGLNNSATRSNHLSGTATDTNWSKHPFPKGSKRRPGFSFTPAGNRIMDSFDSRLGGILRSGRDFLDEMHWEIAPGVTAAQTERVARELRKTFQPPRTDADVRDWQRLVGVKEDGLAGRGTVAATRALQDRLGVRQTGLLDEATKKALNARPAWQTTEHMKRVQHLLNEVTATALDVDGKWGKATTAATLAYQRETPAITADGSPGPNTLKALEAEMSDITDRLDAIQRRADDNGRLLKRLPADTARAILSYTNPRVSGGDKQVYSHILNASRLGTANLDATATVGDDVTGIAETLDGAVVLDGPK